jgi:putative FmdB family regulatory protein
VPNYEYKCKECDNKFEIWQEVGAEAPSCPKCAGEVKKVLHAPKLHFKGSGFYVTDVRNEKKGNKPAESSSGEAKTEVASETKTETKSETSSPAKTETAAA